MPGNLSGSVDADVCGAPVLDRAVFDTLANLLGQPRMMRMTAAFMLDAERRLLLLDRDDATSTELQDHAHALVSMAGHLGFMRLSALCRDLQDRARHHGGGLDQRPALRTALDQARKALRDAVTDDLVAQPVPASDLRPPQPSSATIVQSVLA